MLAQVSVDTHRHILIERREETTETGEEKKVGLRFMSARQVGDNFIAGDLFFFLKCTKLSNKEQSL